MKHNAKQFGSGGRLRLVMLLATAVAVLLIPAAAASAAPPVTVEFAGSGSGTVEGEGELGGVPHLECHWNGETGTSTPEPCTVEASEGEFTGILAAAYADPGSKFAGWEAIEGIPVGCEEKGEAAVDGELCGVITFGGPIVIKATFNGPPTFPLSLTTSGTGSGSFKCDTGSGAEACKAEYAEGKEVEVIPVAGTGSDFIEFNAENGGECSGASCTVIMSEARSVNAQFDLKSLAFSTTVIGEGTVECNSEPCAAEYTYGEEVEVTATPNNIEYVLAEISGTGSASGCEASGCSFTVTEASSITAEFKTAAFKSEAEGNVHGEVPETTTLESECEDVDLGLFIPGVTADYSNTCGVVLTSTGAETKFIASDESAVHTGHLVQGSYFLPSALEAMAEDSEGKGTGPGLTPLSPVTLLTFGEPIAKDAATVTFSQHIDEHDGLHTGEYAKTITLTLEQTTP